MEYTRSIRGPFEHGSSEAAKQRGNKITKQTQFRRTQRESMVYSLFPVRRGGRTHQIRRIGPAGYKSSFAAGREAPKAQQGGRACSADLALFQRPRPCAATEQQNCQTNPIPNKALFCRHLRKVWRADRVPGSGRAEALQPPAAPGLPCSPRSGLTRISHQKVAKSRPLWHKRS